jgi:hypothetical protein
MPESRIDDLNPEQLRAATAGEGPVLSIAGPARARPKLLRRGWPGSCRRGSIRAGSCFLRSRAGLRTRCCAGRGEPWVKPEAARSEPSGWHLSLRSQPVAAHLWGTHRARSAFYGDGSVGCRGSDGRVSPQSRLGLKRETVPPKTDEEMS